MPWNLPEFERNRLERGRRLLQESEEHRGCRDLQLYVEGMDLTVQLHRIFLDDSGQRRQGLTAQEKLQVLGSGEAQLDVFWHNNMKDVCMDGVVDAILEIRQSSLPPWGDLMADIANAACGAFRASDMPLDVLELAPELTTKITALPDFSALSAAIETHQRSEGFDPVLSAADLHMLVLHSQQEAAKELLKRQPDAPAAQQWLEAGLSANSQLLQQDTSNAACLQYEQGSLLALSNLRTEAVAAYCSALREVAEHKSHLIEVMAARELAVSIPMDAAEPRSSMEEARSLLRTAKTALAKCEPWLPLELHADTRSAIVYALRKVEGAAAEVSRQRSLKAAKGRGDADVYVASIVLPECSGCGQPSSNLNTCGSCHVAAYCSRACQVQHWKRGGHKQECAQLAAGSSSGGAGGSTRS